jgi:hypothetical protein
MNRALRLEIFRCPQTDSGVVATAQGRPTRSVIAEVTRQNDTYVFTARIKQTEFGIQLLKIAGRVIKVKDELDISFRLYTVTPIHL